MAKAKEIAKKRLKSDDFHHFTFFYFCFYNSETPTHYCSTAGQPAAFLSNVRTANKSLNDGV